MGLGGPHGPPQMATLEKEGPLPFVPALAAKRVLVAPLTIRRGRVGAGTVVPDWLLPISVPPTVRASLSPCYIIIRLCSASFSSCTDCPCCLPLLAYHSFFPSRSFLAGFLFPAWPVRLGKRSPFVSRRSFRVFAAPTAHSIFTTTSTRLAFAELVPATQSSAAHCSQRPSVFFCSC